MRTTPCVKAVPNLVKGLSIYEVGVGETLCPYIMLNNYFTVVKNMPDFTPDMYEALRQTDKDGGSNIEKERRRRQVRARCLCSEQRQEQWFGSLEGCISKLNLDQVHHCWPHFTQLLYPIRAQPSARQAASLATTSSRSSNVGVSSVRLPCTSATTATDGASSRRLPTTSLRPIWTNS